MQEKLAQNVYVTELPTGAQNKEGFSEFACNHLKINASPKDIRDMYNVNRGQEPVTKIIFDSVETKNIYYNARRNLRDQRHIWIRGGFNQTTSPSVIFGKTWSRARVFPPHLDKSRGHLHNLRS